MSAALTAALDGVAGASTAVLSVLAAIMVYAAAVYGYRRILQIIALPNPGAKP